MSADPLKPVEGNVDAFVRGDGRVVAPKIPKKARGDWRKGYEAGVAATLIAVHRAAPARFSVGGGLVFVLADHHLELALEGAMARLRRAGKTR